MCRTIVSYFTQFVILLTFFFTYSRADDCHYEFNDLCIKWDSCNSGMQGECYSICLVFQT